MRKNRWAVAGAALYVAAVCCVCGTQNVNTESTEQDVVWETTDTEPIAETTPEAAGEGVGGVKVPVTVNIWIQECGIHSGSGIFQQRKYPLHG